MQLLVFSEKPNGHEREIIRRHSRVVYIPKEIVIGGVTYWYVIGELNEQLIRDDLMKTARKLTFIS